MNKRSILITGFLFACLPTSPVSSPESDVSPGEVQPAPAAGLDAGSLRVHAEGVGDLTAKTPFDLSSVAFLLPAMTVSQAMENTADGPTNILLVHYEDTLMMKVRGSSDGLIESITVLSPLYYTDEGFHIGQRKAKLSSLDAQCSIDPMGAADRVICSDGSPLFYGFEGKARSADGEVPTDKQLRRWHLQSITWDAQGAP